MNALDRVLGRKLSETTTTGDVAPVVATVPTWQHIKRKKDGEKKKPSGDVASVIGETREEPTVIPNDAEEAEEGDFNGAQGVNVPKPKEAKANPDQPATEEDKLLAPQAALVAPDVTPDAMTEIDPSQVPGRANGQSFRASDLNPQPQTQPGQDDRTDPAVSQMDILLGRQRNTPNGPGSPPPTQPVMTEDSAAALFNATQKSPDELMAAGVEVPPPTGRVDAKTVCEATRKWM